MGQSASAVHHAAHAGHHAGHQPRLGSKGCLQAAMSTTTSAGMHGPPVLRGGPEGCTWPSSSV